MDLRWLGPFTIQKVLEKGFYTLGSLEGNSTVTKRIHGAHLELYLSLECSSDEHVSDLWEIH